MTSQYFLINLILGMKRNMKLNRLKFKQSVFLKGNISRDLYEPNLLNLKPNIHKAKQKP